MTIWAAIACALAALTAPRVIHARDAVPQSRAAITRPVLTRPSAPEYPPAAAAVALEGEVVLELTIDGSGKVADASVNRALGYGCDEAALAAARHLVFTPALRGGEAVAAKILFAYRFAPAVGPAAPSAAPANGGTIPAATPPDSAAAASFIAPESAAPAARLPLGTNEPPQQAAPVEILVRGVSVPERARQSAHAVDVVELADAQRKSADLGEVLARSRGVTVQRSGGLGSESRFSLNGLEDDQIRFFLDGIPLDFAGFSLGFANVPVNLVQRVDVYRGVVPARFGADALGGAVDLVTDDDVARSTAAFSYQAGSFDTHRLNATATAALPRGWFLRNHAFFDTTQNDYPVDVEVPDADGRIRDVRVRRFHDAYRAKGVGIETGVTGRPYARLLALRAFYADSAKEVQHDPAMVTPYGEIDTATRNLGAHVRYRQRIGRGVHFDGIAGYAFGKAAFRDVSRCIYDWFGQCVRERHTEGESQGRPRDSVTWNSAFFLRSNATWRLAPDHEVKLAVAPDLTLRDGDERREATTSGTDALEARQTLGSAVLGIEYQVHAAERALQNIAFVKSYSQVARSRRNVRLRDPETIERSTQQFGAGNALRFRFTPAFWAKLSYEYATRLPRADEVFGDGILVEANLELEPEVSHNANLGATLDLPEPAAGSFRFELNGFYRDATNLIRRVGAAFYFRHQNVASVRTLGAEASARWQTPGEYLTLAVVGTAQDSRNTSASGVYAPRRGDRIPNRPYLFGNAEAALKLPRLFVDQDSLSATWTSRYVHQFFRTWESLGAREGKLTIPNQLVHSIGVVYAVARANHSFSSALELQNVTDSRAFDFYGVQRPGRATFLKVSFQI